MPSINRWFTRSSRLTSLTYRTLPRQYSSVVVLYNQAGNQRLDYVVKYIGNIPKQLAGITPNYQPGGE
jgi:hypothetical protein